MTAQQLMDFRPARVVRPAVLRVSRATEWARLLPLAILIATLVLTVALVVALPEVPIAFAGVLVTGLLIVACLMPADD